MILFGRVKKIFKQGDTLILLLDSARGYTGLSYIPNHYYQNTSIYYEGPWLINRRKIGAFSFYKVPIIPYFKPKAQFGYMHQCLGDTSAFIDSSTVAYKNIINYKWIFGDNQQSILKNPFHIYAKDTVYKVTLTVTGAFNRKDSVTRNVRIYPLPEAHFTYKVLNGTKVQFIPTDTTNTNYVWDFGDGSYSNRMKKIYVYAGSGKYVVTLLAQKNGCTYSYRDTVSVVSAHTDFVKPDLENINLYPNPFNNKIIVEMYPVNKVHTSVKMFNIAGVELTLPIESNIQNGKFELNTEILPAGIYLLQIITDAHIINRRIVKMQP